jgi:hypothetical protein
MITIRIEGASADEIQRRLVAAQAVFDRAGVTALQVAEARFAREGWDIGGFADPAPATSISPIYGTKPMRPPSPRAAQVGRLRKSLKRQISNWSTSANRGGRAGRNPRHIVATRRYQQDAAL